MFKKYFLRILVGFSILILTLGVIVTVVTFIYKQEIKQRIMTEINARLKKPMKIEHISVSIIHNFPGITFSLHNVFVPKADSSSRLPLIQLKKLSIVFNAFKILVGNYSISEVEFSDGLINAKVDANGIKDFEIWHKKSDTVSSVSKPPEDIELNIEKVLFSNVELSYENDFKPKKLRLVLKSTTSFLHVTSKEVTGDLKGIIYSHEFTLKPGTLFREAVLNSDFHFGFNIPAKVFSFNDCVIETNKDVFIANGSIDFIHQSLMTLHIKTTQANIDRVFRLLPHRWSKTMDSLEMKGNINADATIVLSLLPGRQPNLNIDFNTDNFQVKRRGMISTINDLHFKGNLTSTDSLTMEHYQLTLTDLKGKIDSTSVISSDHIHIKNFLRPVLFANIDLDLQSKTLFNLIKFTKYEQVSGKLKVQLKYDGYLNYLFGKESQVPDMRGVVEMQNVGLKLKELSFPFDKINGNIDFSNDTIRIKNVKINRGKTDMLIQGTAFHLFHSVFRDTTGLQMNVDFTSTNFYYADFNLKSSKPKKAGAKRKSTLKVDHRHIVLPFDARADFTGKISNFYSRNYKGENILLKAHFASDKIEVFETMNTFGGTMNVSNRIMANGGGGLNYHTNVVLKNVQVKKVFKAFSNFNQKFITSDKIEGALTGVFNIYFKTDNTLKIDTSTVVVKGNYTIKDLELRDVEPLMKLSKVGFDEKDLSAITCKEITSEISIDGNQVTIPRTLLVTNILYLYLQVKLQIGGEVDILALIPVKNIKKQPNTDELTNDSQVGMALPLRISGTAGNLKPQLIKIKK